MDMVPNRVVMRQLRSEACQGEVKEKVCRCFQSGGYTLKPQASHQSCVTHRCAVPRVEVHAQGKLVAV